MAATVVLSIPVEMVMFYGSSRRGDVTLMGSFTTFLEEVRCLSACAYDPMLREFVIVLYCT
jgi:hypothetical protein